MTDKIQKILEDVERLCNAGLHNSTISKKNVLNTILAVVNDFKEEPVSEDFEKKFISFVDATHDNNGSYSLHDFAQRLYNIAKEELKEPVEKNFEIALANEWKGYNDRGAATVDALEDNTQELAFAKGFYRGSNWKEQQMIANAIDAEVLENYDGKVIKYDDTILDEKLSGCKVFDKIKIIVIKEK